MQPLMAWKASPTSLEDRFAGVDLTGKQVDRQVNRDAIASVLRSMQPSSGLESLDRLSSDCKCGQVLPLTICPDEPRHRH